MARNKKIFLILSILFLLIMAYISYDISSRTTFPGSKGLLKERIMPSDTVEVEEDTVTENLNNN